jgi:hypothetical protein
MSLPQAMSPNRWRHLLVAVVVDEPASVGTANAPAGTSGPAPGAAADVAHGNRLDVSAGVPHETIKERADPSPDG